ncbi:kinase-like domain-containing protein [Mucor mucedo]|uniref:kinase-like domain-containing protein n=1 Tax=Mucor mucedo TaxID=29922 RepID=UPI00221FB03E|nr:kinase-like domain-containing protein [Mucor mucedo]KAI7888873.1 kinase-like domain-containing protein [Mucor mucedo]
MATGDEGEGEINICTQFNHKNIFPLRDVVVDTGRNVYILLPRMEHDLPGLMYNPNVQLTPQEIKTYLKNGILHRDIKASNILDNNDGIIQIADIGLARDIKNGNQEYTKSAVLDPEKIFNLCPSPNQQNMPNWHKLPDARKTRCKNTVRRVRREYYNCNHAATDLLDKLLILDPTKRLICLEALEHTYFWSLRLPANPVK